MIRRARHPRRIPLILLGLALAALLAPATRGGAAEDPLDTLAGPPSSRFT